MVAQSEERRGAIRLNGLHHLGSSSAAGGQVAGTETRRVAHAGCSSTPCGTCPATTKRQTSTNSFLASATIRTLRTPPRALSVRDRYHCHLVARMQPESSYISGLAEI